MNIDHILKYAYDFVKRITKCIKTQINILSLLFTIISAKEFHFQNTIMAKTKALNMFKLSIYLSYSSCVPKSSKDIKIRYHKMYHKTSFSSTRRHILVSLKRYIRSLETGSGRYLPLCEPIEAEMKAGSLPETKNESRSSSHKSCHPVYRRRGFLERQRKTQPSLLRLYRSERNLCKL